ncbi:MAG: hypothetical protein RLZZ561_2041 [Pseudomonadota bacterium]
MSAPLMAQAIAPPPTAQPQWPRPLIYLGESSGGRQILVDVSSLKTAPPLRGLRDFPVAQVFVEMRGPGAKGSVERVRYSFNCRARSVAALNYARFVSGKKSHDWQGADYAPKYERVSSGTLVEMAMTYACSGGKLPKTPPKPALPGSDTLASDGDGG